MNLNELTVADLIPYSRHLVTSSSANTVKDFLEILSKTHLTSLPLFKFPENSFVGFVDCLDVAGLLVDIATQSATAHPGSEPSLSLKTDDLETLFRRSQQFNSRQLADLVSRAKANRPNPSEQTIGATAPLAECINKMVQGAHRLIVTGTGPDHLGFNILTQSDLVLWLSQDTERRIPKAKLRRTARELGWCEAGRVVQVRADQPAIEALQFMISRSVPALAIVNQDGALRDTISASDLRRPDQWNFQDFLQPIGQLANSLRKGRKPVSLSPNDSFEEFVLAFRQARVHRLFICEAGKPIGLVALADVLSQIVKGEA